MADPSRSPQADDDAPTPRWLYAVGLIVIVFAAAFIVMHFASGGLPRH